jgi:Ca2+-binding RTX toxin-like protein
MCADTEKCCGSFVDSWCRSLGVGLVAVVVALAAVCVVVPAAQAQSQVAFQGSNGSLWTWGPQTGASDLSAGMMAGTSPSINNRGEIAFQADTGSLWTNKSGDLGLGMMKGTSPSIDDSCCATYGEGGQIVFQADTGDLWQVGGASNDASWHLGMQAGTSPSIAPDENPNSPADYFAFQANTGHLWNLFEGGSLTPDTGAAMLAGTSPSINVDGTVAFQGSNGSLWYSYEYRGTWQSADLGTAMMAGTSPSINGNGDIAFQANNSHLTTYGGDTGQRMGPGTSPSIDAYGKVAFQGSNGNLWTWDDDGDAFDTGAGMMARTSPSIQYGVDAGAPQTTSVIRGGPDNDRLEGGSANNLIRSGRGNDLISGGKGNDRSYGGRGNDRSYGGRGNDLLYGGQGNDRIYGGPGRDQIVDHRGATTAFAGSGSNLVDVDDGRGDDRVVCKPGTITDFFADRGDRIARSCNERLAGRIEIPGLVRSR